MSSGRISTSIVLRLGHHGDGGGGGVDPSLRLGHGHALDAVHAGLVLELGERLPTADLERGLLEAADVGPLRRQHLRLPPVTLGEAAVHVQQLAGEQRRLLPAGPGSDLEDHVLAVVGVLRHQQRLERGRQRRRPGRAPHRPRHGSTRPCPGRARPSRAHGRRPPAPVPRARHGRERRSPRSSAKLLPRVRSRSGSEATPGRGHLLGDGVVPCLDLLQAFLHATDYPRRPWSRPAAGLSRIRSRSDPGSSAWSSKSMSMAGMSAMFMAAVSLETHRSS